MLCVIKTEDDKVSYRAACLTTDSEKRQSIIVNLFLGNLNLDDWSSKHLSLPISAIWTNEAYYSTTITTTTITTLLLNEDTCLAATTYPMIYTINSDVYYFGQLAAAAAAASVEVAALVKQWSILGAFFILQYYILKLSNQKAVLKL